MSILVACGLLVATTYSNFTLTYLSQFASIYSYCFLILLFAALLPGRLLLLSLPLAYMAVRAINRVNRIKISLVSLPITFFDVKGFIADPSVVVNAIGIRDTLYKGLWLAVAGLAGTLLVFFASRIGKSSSADPERSRSPRAAFSLGMHVVAFTAVLIAGEATLARYGRFVQTNLVTIDTELWLELWLPSAHVALSRKLGVLEYLAFSATVPDHDADLDLYPGPGPTAEELRRAAAEFVNDRAAPNGLLPNIVMFHAESTFDPNTIFRLSERIELPLWSKRSETRALGPLRVNVIGGGSWVTEFEVLTGVDSRLFGYDGFYTHYYIAPRVKNSFVKYLARKGYDTAAFYPVKGDFYNTATAFGFYGFHDFVDARALGLSDDWAISNDLAIIKAGIAHGAFTHSGPFLRFLGTNENHGPHRCQHFASLSELPTTFAGPASFEENCQLNEYLRRAASTSAAFELVLEQLEQVEQQTGRPFVLLVYGDHQPWSFTEGIYSVAGGTITEEGFKKFSGVRTDADGFQTFFHLLASDGAIVRSELTGQPPASLLPSLVSAFVATSADDIFLPVNFLAFKSCGSDLRRPGCERYGQIAGSLKTALLTDLSPGPWAPAKTSR